MTCFGVDGSSSTNGDCEEGTPSVEERDEEQYKNNRANSRN